MKTRMKMLAVAALAYVPLAMARETPSYPKEKLAAFVVEKLDVTSLPSAYRPKKENGKKTLADYGYTPQQIDEKQALLGASDGVRTLSIKILQDGAIGIYACVAKPGPDGGDRQSVVLLKRKDSSALLKGRQSSKEFTSCPVIGGGDSDFPTSSY
jgi:hypothetical protein